MTELDTRSKAPSDPGRTSLLRRMAWWQHALVVSSIVCMVAGVALPVVFGGPDAPAQTASATGEGAGTGGSAPGGGELDPSGFAPTQPPNPDDPATGDPAGEAAAADRESVVSPTLFRLGFSFFVGFAMGFALRSFVKISITVIGVYLLLLFGLEYAGFVDVRWSALGEQYHSASGWLEVEFASFRSFMTGRLPAAGAAIAGLGIGFTRRA